MVDPKVMAESEFYPHVPTPPAARGLITGADLVRRRVPSPADVPAPTDLEARVAELERVIATVASLRLERMTSERPDPVALTKALHPKSLRGARNAKSRATSGGKLAVRFFMFDPSTSH